MSQSKIAKKLKCSQGFVSMIYNGKARVSPEMAEMIAKVTGASIRKVKAATENLSKFQKLLDTIG